LVTLAGVILLAGTAAAQNQNEWNGGFYLGYATSTDPDSPDGSLGGMANVLAMFAPAFGAGVELGFFRLGDVSRTFEDQNMMPVEGKVTFSTWQTTAAVVGQYPGRKFRPYGVGGAGFYGVRTVEEAAGFSQSDTRSRFGINLGGGLKFLPSDGPWGVGLDLRWHLVFEGLPEDGGDLNMFTALVGLNYN
jgi:opacity protein-like surface antigen